jgi:hypothetical protein
MRLASGLLLVALLVLAALWRFWPARALSDTVFAAHYAAKVTPPDGPVAVYHLGHSLVGRDMPAMLAAMSGHPFNSQLGWGASLMNHWKGDVPGFAEENRPPAFRDAGQAVDSGDYPVVVLTEMVELRDAIRWHHSADYLARWASRAKAANPGVRVYLYETWHRLDDPAGWAERVAADLPDLWEGQVLRPAVARAGVIRVIPGGQVMAALVAKAEAGHLPGVTGKQDFFTDEIHVTGLGAYAMALTHHAVIYARSPRGLPARIPGADGTLIGAPSEEAARVMQEVVWRVVTGYPLSGVGVE